jgi:peroxin-1
MSDFEAAQIGYTPVSLRDVKLQKSDVEWADIGGRCRPGHSNAIY